MKNFVSFLLAVPVFFAMLITLNVYTESYIKSSYRPLFSEEGGAVFNQGLILQKMAASRNNALLIFGSSELETTNLDQHPVNFFPRKECNAEVAFIGRGYCTPLIHLMNFMAISNYLKGKKIVFIISLQWFLLKDGLPLEGFKMNFSPLHFYTLMKNRDLPEEFKRYIAKRVISYTNKDLHYINENFYAKIYIRNKFIDKMFFYLFKPFYEAWFYILQIKDSFRSYLLLKSAPEVKKLLPSKLKKIDWEQEMIKAEVEGRRRATNDFFIEDSLYRLWYIRHYRSQKNRYLHINLFDSKEYSDLIEFLKFCYKQDLKPLFIIMPVMGKWYDYLGLDVKQRSKFYDYMETLIKLYGFKAEKFPEKEYEPYFMLDSEHLGWKGWLNVNKKIVEYFNETPK